MSLLGFFIRFCDPVAKSCCSLQYTFRAPIESDAMGIISIYWNVWTIRPCAYARARQSVRRFTRESSRLVSYLEIRSTRCSKYEQAPEDREVALTRFSALVSVSTRWVELERIRAYSLRMYAKMSSSLTLYICMICMCGVQAWQGRVTESGGCGDIRKLRFDCCSIVNLSGTLAIPLLNVRF